MATPHEELAALSDYKYGFRDDVQYTFRSRKGLNAEVVRELSLMKGEPQWMLDFRLKALEIFTKKPVPTWGGKIDLDFDEITYYTRPSDKTESSWDDVPADIKNTFDKLGIPEAERKFLAGVGAQYESEMVYHSVQKHLEEQGVIFLSSDDGLRQHPEIFREHFGKVIPATDNKFAACNSAVWSGGSFVYVPQGVKVEMPLQAYFRLNAEGTGQFERTLIIIDEGAQAHYVEGCTAPAYSRDSFHSGVIEIIVKKGARMRYTTIQNWSTNVYNLVTQRAVVHEGATMEWVDANLGCLAEGMTVVTPDGVKPIEAVEVGEEVLSFDETTGEMCFRAVSAKRFSGYQHVREVSWGERRIWVTANHPFYSYQYDPTAPKKLGRYRLGYVRADQLTEAIVPRASLDYGQPYPLAQPSTTTAFTPNNQYAQFEAVRDREQRLASPDETTPELMWLFGLFLGDGHINRQAGVNGGTRYAKVGFSTPRDDRAREKLMATMEALMSDAPTERRNGIHLDWNSVELADLFEVNGFIGTARTKRIPEWVFSLPEAQRLSLLAGYLDADGCLTEAKRRLSIKSVNADLLEDVARLATTLGIAARIATEYDGEREVVIAGTPATAHGSHRIDIPIDERLLPFLSESFRKKAQAVRPPKAAFWRKVGRSSIELPDALEIVPVSVGAPSNEKMPTWDIEVEGTGNFVAEGFIVHNSKLTMKYPSCYLVGEGAHGEILSMAFAGPGQHQDTGGKVVHGAPRTTSKITSKSISRAGGRASYRGLLKVYKGAEGSKSNVVCDALLLDPQSRSDTYPVIEIDEDDVTIGHEASVSKIGEEQLFYLMSRGLTQDQAASMVVGGFIEPLVKELPMEYAIELNRLVQLQMEGSIG